MKMQPAQVKPEIKSLLKLFRSIPPERKAQALHLVKIDLRNEHIRNSEDSKMDKISLFRAKVKDTRWIDDFKPVNAKPKKGGLYIIKTSTSWPSIDINLANAQSTVYTVTVSSALKCPQLMEALDNEDQETIKHLARRPAPQRPVFNSKTYRPECQHRIKNEH